MKHTGRTKRRVRRVRRHTRRRQNTRRIRGGMSQPTIFTTYAGLPEAKERPTYVFSKLDPRDEYAPRVSITLSEAERAAINATIPE